MNIKNIIIIKIMLFKNLVLKLTDLKTEVTLLI
jgi:hypothetical protein